MASLRLSRLALAALAAAPLLALPLAGCDPVVPVSDQPTPPPPAPAAPTPSGVAYKPFDPAPFKGDGNVVTTKSGLKYEEMTVGTGAEAKSGSKVYVWHTGTLEDGTKFDSSRDRNTPFDFTIDGNEVIKGWDEGIKGMKVGGRRKLTVPGDLAYGPQGRPPTIPPNATLIFDVELAGIQQ